MSNLDMKTEDGRLMLRDLIKFQENGFSPFDPESYQSKKFWKSREEYQKYSFGTFLAQTRNMAQIAIAQMPSKERKTEEKK